jgi:hypothetical protein
LASAYRSPRRLCAKPKRQPFFSENVPGSDAAAEHGRRAQRAVPSMA